MDLISREAAIDALREKVFHELSDEFYGAMQVLDELPPVDIREQSVDIGYLYEWYQDSVDPDDEPVWTKKHIEEIFHDFYLIPKQEGGND